MPELRRDPVVGYWTIISTERSRRPVAFSPRNVEAEQPCPFCEGKEKETTSEIHAVRKPGTKADGPGWDVRVIQSKKPILQFAPDGIHKHGRGMYDLMNGVGTHEIIIESPSHRRGLDELPVKDIEKVIRVYIDRLAHLKENPVLKYGLLFKNHGLISGSERDVVRHTRSQLIATPVTPKRVKEELHAAKSYFDRHERCVFCDILEQETQDASRIVLQNEHFLAFCPYASRSPFEIWILPKKHTADFDRLEGAAVPAFAAALKESLSKLKTLLNDPPYNFILHTAPFRRKKKEGYWLTMDEDYHWYFQIAPRLAHDAGFEWGTGIYINPTPPEEAAHLLRETEVPA